MADYSILMKDARKELDSSEHLLFVTFNLVKDSKFVFTVTTQLISSLRLGLEALLEYDRQNKNIEPFPRHFPSMVETFKTKVSERREFDPATTGFLRRMIELEQSLKTSSIHFRREDTYVIADEEYGTKSYDMNTIKSFFSQAQEFIDKVGEIIVKN